MFIGLKNIAEHFPDAEHLIREDVQNYCLTGYEKLSDAVTPYILHKLYICDETFDIHSIEMMESMHILCLASSDTNLDDLSQRFPAHINILLLKEEGGISFYRQLRDFFDINCGVALIGNTFLEILSFEGGIQSMIDYAFLALNNPIFVFDASFNLIAANWEEAEKHESARSILHNKGFSENEFKIANSRNHIHEKVKVSEMPIIAYNEVLKYNQMLCAIDTQKDLGHIVVSELNRPFTESDKKILWVLKRYIDQQLKKDEFIRNSKGFHYEYFLKDLLDGKIATSNAFLDRMNYVGSAFEGNMYCLVIETARTSSALNTYRIRNQFENRFANTKTLLYNGEIIILLSVPKDHFLTQKQIEVATELCVENGLYAGLSNCFDNIMKLAEYYKQALRAIELGICTTNRPSLFLYKQHYLEHIKNIFLQKESSDTFCHPKMRFLLNYDKKHHSELAYTLYMYLLHERNTAAASAAMFMHRTSLIYRFKKIVSLIGDEFEDAKERQYLIISYELNKPE